MIVQPKRPFSLEHRDFADPQGIVEIPSDTQADLFIECEVIAPRSQVGRTVYLHVPAEQIVALMKASKRHAIAVRDKGERAVSP